MPQITEKPPPALEDAAMRAMFAARKEVFIDLLRWDLPVLGGQFELDQFDDTDAEYLILTEDDGKHRASARLLRTDRPHLLGDLYPQLCQGPLPSGPTIREITRFCLDRHQCASDRRHARNQLVSLLVEHALRSGITGYTGVANHNWFEQVMTFGWDCRALGAPVYLGDCRLVGLHIRIDDHTIERLAETGVYRPTGLTAASAHQGKALS